MEFLIFSGQNRYPNFMSIGGYELYVPNQSVRLQLRQECEEYLRSNFKPGVYFGEDANGVSQCLYSFYETQFRNELHNIDNEYFIYLTLFHCDVASRINNLYKNRNLDKSDKKYWLENGPLIRRTLSYLLDEMIFNFSYTSIPAESFISSLSYYDRLFILSEKAINYSIISNEIYYLNDSYKVRINPPGSKYFIESISTKKSKDYARLHKYYMRQSTRDAALRLRYTIGKPYESDWIKHGTFLNDAFIEVFGSSYHQYMFLLSDLIINTKPIDDEKDIPLVRKDEFIESISNQIQINKTQLNRFFEGLTLSKELLVRNRRTFFKFKQDYRVGKRPFLEIQKNGETYLSWSNEMLKERLDFLDNDFVFKTLPAEWNLNPISEAVSKMSNDAGIWFEDQVKENFVKIGVIGDHIKDKFCPGKDSLNCLSVGGFDFLGYSSKENMLILIECKFINPGFEPRSYYDDLSSFKDPKKGYVKKLDNKVEWLAENFNKVKRDLSVRLKIKIPVTCNIIGTAFFTYIKTFAFAFIDKYPCVSFTEFFDNYSKEQTWYLKTGLFEINKTCA